MTELIECPWCGSQIVITESVCPECRQEVLPEHLSESLLEQESVIYTDEPYIEDLPLDIRISSKFVCSRCRGTECSLHEVALDARGVFLHKRYVFVTCSGCGSVEVYDPDVLRGKTAKELDALLDRLFRK